MKIVPFAASFLLALSLVGSARADWDGLGLGYLFGYRNFGGFGYNINNQTPPYFALHPPVYYGQRYTRPYGASPFAAWPQLQANPAYAPAPHVQRATIVNPHCSHCAVGGVVNAPPISRVMIASEQRVEPAVIQNPYFRQPAEVAAGKYTTTQE